MKITKYILFLGIIAVGVLTLYIFGNNLTPLGYDHGAYRHYMGLIETYGQAHEMAIQFEPFFAAFVRVITVALPADIILTWGYLMVYIAISMCVFILGKSKNKYTLASYLGGILALLSIVQYKVFWLGLGKEMFATIFLLLSIRYYKKVSVYIIFTAACIALHRLTGIFSAIFALIVFITDKRSWQEKIYIFISILLGVICYISTLKIHILPLLSGNLERHIFIPGWSGSLFGEKIFWSVESIVLAGGIFLNYFYHKKSKKYIFKGKKYYFFLTAALLLFLRISGHTRIGAFFDIFLILYIAQMALHIQKKYIFILLILQGITWAGYVYENHTPTIPKDELVAIKNIKENMIDSSYLLNFNKAYDGWILGYSGLSISSLYEIGIKEPKKKQDKIHMRDNPNLLCSLLNEKNKTVYIFMGRLEKSTFPEKATCIREIKTFANGAKLFIYRAR